MISIDTKISGVAFSKDELTKLSTELNRDFISLAFQGARGLAVDLGNNTQPYGLRESSGAAMMLKVENDIQRLYPALEDGKSGASRIFSLLEDQVSLAEAKKFFAMWKADGREGADRYFSGRIKGLQKRLDAAAHSSARKGKKRSVPGKARPLALVNAKRRATYIRKKQRTVGMAKAGWLHAAKGLGGRVRRGGGRSGGTSNTFPRWVTRAGSRQKLGTAAVSTTSTKVYITLRNSVKHARFAMTSRDVDRAERSAERRFYDQLANARKYKTRRANSRLRRAS